MARTDEISSPLHHYTSNATFAIAHKKITSYKPTDQLAGVKQEKRITKTKKVDGNRVTCETSHRKKPTKSIKEKSLFGLFTQVKSLLWVTSLYDLYALKLPAVNDCDNYAYCYYMVSEDWRVCLTFMHFCTLLRIVNDCFIIIEIVWSIHRHIRISPNQ